MKIVAFYIYSRQEATQRAHALLSNCTDSAKPLCFCTAEKRKKKKKKDKKKKKQKRNKHYIYKLPINRPIAALPGSSSSLREFAWRIRTSSCGPAREGTPPNGVGWHLRTGQDRAKPGKTGQNRACRRIDGFHL